MSDIQPPASEVAAQPASSGPKRRFVIPVLVALAVVAASALGYVFYQHQQAVAQNKTISSLKGQASNDIKAYGTYDYTNYDQYLAKVKPLLTPRYYGEAFSPSFVSHRKDELMKYQISVDLEGDPTVGKAMVTLSGAHATVTLPAVQDISTPDALQPASVDLLITYLKQNDKWLIDNIVFVRHLEYDN